MASLEAVAKKLAVSLSLLKLCFFFEYLAKTGLFLKENPPPVRNSRNYIRGMQGRRLGGYRVKIVGGDADRKKNSNLIGNHQRQ